MMNFACSHRAVMHARVLKSSNAPRDCLFNRTVSYEDISILDQKNLNGVHSISIPSLFILPHLTTREKFYRPPFRYEN